MPSPSISPQTENVFANELKFPSTTLTSSSPESKSTHELRPRPLSNPTIWRLFDDEHFPHLLKTILDLSELPHGAFPSDSEDDSEDEDFEASSEEDDPYEYDSQFDSDFDDLDSIPSNADGFEMDIFGMDARDVAAALESRDKSLHVPPMDDSHDESQK